eukprot:TRINITY_DN4167_c0_g1_i7.p1 TRINITY_DN4167_c0_g1~~TRINITY_DN4167_c0_g1_i7.p1  ORF type:complete len:1722 (-),score=210.96 TRINITY_DN4167_c0_g1_i7:164-5329(-)
MLGSDCTWKIYGASWVYVDFFDLGSSARLDAESIGFSIPYIPSPHFRNATKNIRLSAQDVNNFIRMDSDTIKLHFSVDSTGTTRPGFKLTFWSCQKGFVPTRDKCSCPSGYFVSLAGDCIQEKYKDNVAQPSIWTSSDSDLRIVSYSSYLGNSFGHNESIFLLNGLKNPNAYEPTNHLDTLHIVKLYTTGGHRYRLQRLPSYKEVPTIQYASCSVISGSRLWIFGGFSESESQSSIRSLSLPEMTWRSHGASPFAQVGGQSCVSDHNLIYIIGGTKQNQIPVEPSYVYNVGLDGWIELPGFHDGPKVAYANAAIFEQDVFIFGGWNGHIEVNTLFMYSKNSQTWIFNDLYEKNIHKLIAFGKVDVFPRQKACSWVLGDEMHIFGGLRQGLPLQDLLVIKLGTGDLSFYEKAADTETWPPNRPQARYGATCCLVGELGFLIGGAIDQLEPAHDIWIYLPDMRAWIHNSISSIPVPRRGHGITVAPNGRFLVFGGISLQSRSLYLNDLWEYWPHNHTWGLLSGFYETSLAPSGRAESCLGEMNGKVYVFGGKSETKVPDSRLWIHTIDSNSWNWMDSTAPSEQQSLTMVTSSAIFQNGWMLVGKHFFGKSQSRVSLLTMAWSEGTIETLLAKNDAPLYRNRAGIAIWNLRVFICGGIDENNFIMQDVWVYLLDSKTWMLGDVNLGGGWLLPSFAPQKRFMAMIGQSTGTTQAIAFLDLETLKIIKNAEQESSTLIEEPGQGCVWEGDKIWVYGGRTVGLHTTEIITISPSTCERNASAIHGDMRTKIIEDGSKDSSYFSPYLCIWTIEKSNIIHVDFDFATGDSLKLRSLGQSQYSFQPVILKGNGTTTISLSGHGLVIELDSNYNLTNKAKGFRIWHTYCPENSVYETKVGCKCDSGSILDELQMKCVPCDKANCDVIDDKGNNRIMLAVLVALAIAVPMGIIIGSISRYYRIRITQSRVKYIRRLMLSEREEFDLGPMIHKDRTPHTFHGSMKNVQVEIDIITASSFSPDSIESRIGIVSLLRHPNIQLYMGACLVNSNLWVATEWMGRDTLMSLIKLNDKHLVKKKVDILNQIASGMMYLHESTPPFVHGSLSSAEVLIDRSFRVKVSGIARAAFGTVTSIIHPLEKIPWCAPEVVIRGEKSTKSDVYSYGIIIWEITHQKYPYTDRDNGMDVMVGVIQNTLRPTILDGCPLDLRDLMQSCWSHLVCDRPSFSEILTSIKETHYTEEISQDAQATSSTETSNADGCYIISIRIWKEDELWGAMPKVAFKIFSSFYNKMRKICTKYCLNLIVEHDFTFWATSPCVESCLRAALTLLSESQSIQCPPELQTLYTKIAPDSGHVLGLRVQIIISGLLREEANNMRRGLLLNTILKTCQQGFYCCQGGQLLVSTMLADHLPRAITSDIRVQKLQQNFSEAPYLELLPTSTKNSAWFDSKEPHIDRLHQTNHALLEEMNSNKNFCLDWNAISSNMLGVSSCALSSVWKAEIHNGSVGVVREFSLRNLTPLERINLKYEIYSARCLQHPNISSLVGYCFSSSIAAVVIAGDLFMSLDIYIKTICEAQSLDRYRFSSTSQILNALSYLHAFDPPYAFRGLDWRNIRVYADGHIQLGFSVFSCEFSNPVQLIPRIACRPPESLSRREAVASGDLYSFGVLLWEISTMTEAFDGLGEIEILTLVTNESPLDLTMIRNHDLGATIRSLINHDPRQRPTAMQIKILQDWWG